MSTIIKLTRKQLKTIIKEAVSEAMSSVEEAGGDYRGEPVDVPAVDAAVETFNALKSDKLLARHIDDYLSALESLKDQAEATAGATPARTKLMKHDAALSKSVSGNVDKLSNAIKQLATKPEPLVNWLTKTTAALKAEKINEGMFDTLVQAGKRAVGATQDVLGTEGFNEKVNAAKDSIKTLMPTMNKSVTMNDKNMQAFKSAKFKTAHDTLEKALKDAGWTDALNAALEQQFQIPGVKAGMLNRKTLQVMLDVAKDLMGGSWNKFKQVNKLQN